MIFKDKILLITGGTGSFGNAVVEKLINSDLKEIRVLSRDEKKQDDMRKKFKSAKLKFHLGDVRDYQSLINSVRGTNYIFHAAAFKQVPSCEFYPLEAVKTNIIGTENILEAAIDNEVEKVVCLSTDKAVYPINAMGISKAMMEKVITAKAKTTKNTCICTTRYGNVLASRGSVIPLFANQIKNSKPITITNPNMTRFIMDLEEAVDLVLNAFKNGSPGDIYVQKSPSAKISTIAETLKEIFRVPNHKINIIGTRHGEKTDEILVSKEEMIVAVDLKKYFRIPPDLRDLNYSKYFDNGIKDISKYIAYSSKNATQLSVKELYKILINLKYDFSLPEF